MKCKKKHKHPWHKMTCYISNHPNEVLIVLLLILIFAVAALIVVTIDYNQCTELIFNGT